MANPNNIPCENILRPIDLLKLKPFLIRVKPADQGDYGPPDKDLVGRESLPAFCRQGIADLLLPLGKHPAPDSRGEKFPASCPQVSG